jgi:ankyrin repeat protein
MFNEYFAFSKCSNNVILLRIDDKLLVSSGFHFIFSLDSLYMDYKEEYDKLFDLIINGKNKEFIDEINKIGDDHSFDINIRNNSGKYFLSYAIIANNIEIVDFLIKNKSRIDIDNDDNSILTIPIHFQYHEMLEILLKGDENTVGLSLVSYRDRTYKIPLHHAINKGDIKSINILLKYKSNADTSDKDGYNSLFYAVKSRSLEICKIILPYISNINAKSVIGENALHIACHLQLYDIAEFLILNKININVYDNETEFTPLHHCINVNNKRLIELLIRNGANVNAQDVYGNTPLHYAVMKENYEIFSLIITHKSIQNVIIFNLWNIEGQIPLHIYLKENYKKGGENKYLDILIEKSNLNIQDRYGYSCLYYLVKLDALTEYTNLLIKKKLDIFVKADNKKRVIDIVPKEDYNRFMDLVIDSYIYNLKNLGKKWTEEWDMICGKSFDALTEKDKQKIIADNRITNDIFINKCKSSIRSKIENILKSKDSKCYDQSYPMIKPIVCINVTEGSGLSFCSFTGSILDILIGLIYLLKSHKNVCSIPSDNVEELYETCKNTDRNKCDLLNFEIIWENKKLNFGKKFVEKFSKCIQKKRFTVIPIGIIMKEGNHAGYLIYDSQNKEIERFETYGGGVTLYGTYYSPELLDASLEVKFKEIDENIKYIRPYQFLPKIGFQLFDIIEKKKKKHGDPMGFCALWGIWYVDMRLTYKDIKRDKLVEILIYLIKKENISFKNMIRNYSARIIKIRDELLAKSKLDINDWINEQYTDNQYFSLLDDIYKTLRSL